MITVHDLAELRERSKQLRGQGRLAFVPTMGNLHDGHLALVSEAQQHADAVAVSIFVNPMQFGANEDLDKYPRTLPADQAALREAGADLLFAPDVATMYPKPLADQTRVEVPYLGDLYCGAARPGHFVGVATVVCKLFNMVQPDLAVFGKKDFQQLMVIRRMVEDLAMPIEIRGLDTVREPDGLAMSSRNQYLTEDERRIAPLLYAELQWLAQRLEQGERDIEALQTATGKRLNAGGFETDYVAIVDASTLQALTGDSTQAVVLAAARLGAARLIDNIEITLNPS